MFSKACEYGIRATIYITNASKSNQRVSLKDIAQAIDSPEAFTAKILQQLARSGIIRSLKGPSGGFEVDNEQRARIRAIDIVTAIDGDQIFHGCGLGLKACNEEKPCPVHDKFKVIREQLRDMLAGTTIAQLAENVNDGMAVLKR